MSEGNKAMVTGKMELSVSDPDGFIANAEAKAAVRRACATLAGVPESYITVMLSRTNAGGSLRRLSTGSVLVIYSISIPEGEGVSVTGLQVQTSLAGWSAMQINDAISLEVDASVGNGAYSIVVTSVSPPSLTIAVTTTLQRGDISGAHGCMAPALANAVALSFLAYMMQR